MLNSIQKDHNALWKQRYRLPVTYGIQIATFWNPAAGERVDLALEHIDGDLVPMDWIGHDASSSRILLLHNEQVTQSLYIRIEEVALRETNLTLRFSESHLKMNGSYHNQSGLMCVPVSAGVLLLSRSW